ncbi:acid protease [Piedraia hortae CBS 480.64]|uniref:Acid protease n=1 Tax=Piedraia hortae CBS 480.64 TaxID=1314780 RepID=A0A6A7C188_9PEZI|nr:acid protease [Piedraia hortae CBS 480.64]
MLFHQIILFISLAAANPLPAKQHFNSKFGTIRTLSSTNCPLTELVHTTKHIPLQSTKQSSHASRALQTIFRPTNGTAPLVATAENSGYSTILNFGGKDYSVIFDTGSSDLWLASSSLKCIGRFHDSLPLSSCNFGPLGPATFTGGQIPNENFNVSYGDGEFVTGVMGREDICLGGVHVANQTAALVTTAFWQGDSSTSGLLGFAYPSLTSAFSGSDPTHDLRGKNNISYTNFIFTAAGRGLIPPLFSLALDSEGGALSLGGLPPGVSHGNFSTTDLKIYNLFNLPRPENTYTYYTVDVGDVSTDDAHAGRDFPAIVDSGTTLSYFSAEVARNVARAFEGSVFDALTAMWYVPCNASQPSVTVKLGKGRFGFKEEDLVLQNSRNRFDMCVLGIQEMDGVHILGDTFLRGVVAVFDIGANKMRFAQRK